MVSLREEKIVFEKSTLGCPFDREGGGSRFAFLSIYQVLVSTDTNSYKLQFFSYVISPKHTQRWVFVKSYTLIRSSEMNIAPDINNHLRSIDPKDLEKSNNRFFKLLFLLDVVSLWNVGHSCSWKSQCPWFGSFSIFCEMTPWASPPSPLRNVT